MRYIFAPLVITVVLAVATLVQRDAPSLEGQWFASMEIKLDDGALATIQVHEIFQAQGRFVTHSRVFQNCKPDGEGYRSGIWDVEGMELKLITRPGSDDQQEMEVQILESTSSTLRYKTPSIPYVYNFRRVMSGFRFPECEMHR